MRVAVKYLYITTRTACPPKKRPPPSPYFFLAYTPCQSRPHPPFFALKTLISLLALLFSLTASAQMWPQPFQIPPYGREVRAVWYCTLGGIDWPGRQYAQTAYKAELQKKKLCEDFDRLQAAGINVILFQARVRGTVTYNSDYEPWDGAISGTPGVAPPYDPLEFAVEEAHRRGMELHAYVVTYPICSTSQAKILGKQAISTRYPGICQRCGDRWFMDPGMPGTAPYLAAICREIVERYDVDGIHLDYIRYPEREMSFNDNIAYSKWGNGAPKEQWKRDQVTHTVRAIHDAVRAVRPWVKLSCSPVGKYADLPRAWSRGWNARDAVSQDAQQWLHDGIMDWLFPMMYFDGENFFPFAANWQQESHGHPVIPGLGIYLLSPNEKNWTLESIMRQMNFLRQIGIGGQAFFRTRFLLDNHKGILDFCREFYAQPALTPPMTWMDNTPPEAPQVTIHWRDDYCLLISWNEVKEDTPVVYNVYREEADGHVELLAHHLKNTYFLYVPALPARLHDKIIVRAMDAYGNESL